MRPSGKSRRRRIGCCKSLRKATHALSLKVASPRSNRRHGDVQHLARANSWKRRQQLLLDRSIISDLVLRHVNNENADSKLCAPTLIVDRDGFVIVEELLDPGVYAFVNENAHSRICELAKSSTARTLCRVMDG